MTEVYGIPNCNTVKKAVQYIQAKNIQVNFHNFKKESISDDKLKEWFDYFGLDTVVNKKSRVYRNLSDEEKSQLEKEDTAPEVLKNYTSVIKRPVIEYKGSKSIGFVPEELDQLLEE